MPTLRIPAVAGQFYPAAFSSLKQELNKLCPDIKQKKDAKALLLPHAGYIYSGRVAGITLANVNLKDIFIILGPNHTGAGEPISMDVEETWQTPLGEIKIQLELAKEILNSSSYITKDSKAHSFEHSIEVQLPFLQHFKSKFLIVPIIIGEKSLEIYKQTGRDIASAIKKLGIQDRVQIIASSDMTHYESASVAENKDKKAMDALLKLDPNLLFDTVKQESISMCGYAPAIIMLEALANLGATRAELIKYENSGATSGDYDSVVGYAGLIFN